METEHREEVQVHSAVSSFNLQSSSGSSESWILPVSVPSSIKTKPFGSLHTRSPIQHTADVTLARPLRTELFAEPPAKLQGVEE